MIKKISILILLIIFFINNVYAAEEYNAPANIDQFMERYNIEKVEENGEFEEIIESYRDKYDEVNKGTDFDTFIRNASDYAVYDSR